MVKTRTATTFSIAVLYDSDIVKAMKEVNGKCYFGETVALKTFKKLAHLLTLATPLQQQSWLYMHKIVTNSYVFYRSCAHFRLMTSRIFSMI